MDYAIGDIQGCYREFMLLLDKCSFNEKYDRLWLVGDLINRGPDSLKVLHFLMHLPIKPIVTLGNHDLHFLAVHAKQAPFKQGEDTFQDCLNAPDVDLICEWLRFHPLFYHDSTLNVSMCHAGLPPFWDETKALLLSKEVENRLAIKSKHQIFFRNVW